MSLTEQENAPAVQLDWLLEIHARHVKVQSEQQPAAHGQQQGTVTRPLPPPGAPNA